MSRTALLVILSVTVSLSGCYNRLTTKQAVNPIQLSTPYGSASDISAEDHKPQDAAEQTIKAYYEARTAAAKEKKNVPDFIQKGTGLVDMSCMWWFQVIEESQKHYQHYEQNMTVLSSLVTALIGVGNLHSDVTAAWGAMWTARAGFEGNFNKAYLLAPNAENVRSTVMAMLAQSRRQRFTEAKVAEMSFARAEAELLDYASICTSANAGRIANVALDKVKITIDRDGAMVVEPTQSAIDAATAVSSANASRKDGINTLKGKIAGLTDDVAGTLAAQIPGSSVPAIKAGLDKIKAETADNHREYLRRALDYTIEQDADLLPSWQGLVAALK